MKNSNLLRSLYPLTNQGHAFVLAYVGGQPHKWDLAKCAINNPPAAKLALKLKALTTEQLVAFDAALPAAAAAKSALESAKQEWSRHCSALRIALMNTAELAEMYRAGEQAEREVEAQERAGHATLPRGWNMDNDGTVRDSSGDVVGEE
jgi:hypothetical protein